MQSRRIKELDGLRALCVLFVVIYHASCFGGGITLPKTSLYLRAIIECVGVNSVNVFFIISGFIITTLLMREGADNGRISLTAFYLRRFFRIIPPFAFYLLALFVLRERGVVYVSNHGFLWSSLFLADTSLFNSHDWFLGHTWSLSIEEQFYILFPPLLCVASGRHGRIMVITLVMLYGMCILLLILYKGDPIGSPSVRLSCFRYIIIGVFLAFNRSFVSAINRPSLFFPLFLALAFISMQLYQTASTVLIIMRGISGPFLLGVFVMWFVENPNKCSLLRWAVVQWVGACSYSIYLWQHLFTAPAVNYCNFDLARSHWAPIGIFLVAAISYYAIERPSIRLGHFISQSLFKRDFAKLKIAQRPSVRLST